MIFKILLETNLQIVFWSVFNPIKAPVIAWFIIDFCILLKTEFS